METTTIDEREARLPKWARERLDDLRRENRRLTERVLTRDRVWALMQRGGEWFSLKFPSKPAGESVYLFTLADNGAHSVCVLGRNDVLFIGRAAKE